MRRRSFLRTGFGLAVVGTGGCGGRRDRRGTTSDDLAPSTVTTTGGEGVEILTVELVLRDREDGPRVHYRLRNGGDADATIELLTVLAIDGGGTYEVSAYVDVPADQEMFVEYPLVRWGELPPAEAAAVRRGDTSLTVSVNGEERPGV